MNYRIRISRGEWNFLYRKYSSSKAGRPCFLTGFHDFLSEKLQMHGIEKYIINFYIILETKNLQTVYKKLLLTILLLLGVKCWLKRDYNWFNRPDTTPVWHARYKCIEKECKAEFEAKIMFLNENDDDDNDVEVEIEMKAMQIVEHEYRVVKKARITGDARAALALKVGCDGVANTLNEQINENKSTIFSSLLYNGSQINSLMLSVAME